MRDAVDPYSLAPSNPYSTWTPKKGNTVISSRCCETLLPPDFDSHELSLAELIDVALQNNPSTKQTWASARAASATYGSSLSPFFPALQLSSFYSRQRSGTPSKTNPAAVGSSTAGSATGGGTTYIPITGTDKKQSSQVPTFFVTEGGPDLTLSYTLFDFGQRTAAALAAREALYFADLSHNQTIQSVLQTVLSDYHSYLYQAALLRSSEADLRNAQSSLDAANEKFALGLAALGDVAQARTQFLQSKINLTTQGQNVENAFAQLATDLGLPANQPFKVQPLPEQINAAPILENLDDLVALAQSRRQDFLAAQADVRSKEALLLGAKRAVYPAIDASVDLGRYYYQKGLHEDYHWTASVSFNLPIFSGYYYRNQIRTAQANVEKSRARMMQTELSVIQNVTTSHKGIQTAAQNLTDTVDYLKAAETEYNIALSGYKAGTATILDVLSAQSSLADARSKQAGAQKDWFISLASLAYATGSLCATPNEDLK